MWSGGVLLSATSPYMLESAQKDCNESCKHNSQVLSNTHQIQQIKWQKMCIVYGIGYYFLFCCPIFLSNIFLSIFIFSLLEYNKGMHLEVNYINWYIGKVSCLVCSKSFLHHDLPFFWYTQWRHGEQCWCIYT
jgi:hypothetical protein